MRLAEIKVGHEYAAQLYRHEGKLELNFDRMIERDLTNLAHSMMRVRVEEVGVAVPHLVRPGLRATRLNAETGKPQPTQRSKDGESYEVVMQAAYVYMPWGDFARAVDVRWDQLGEIRAEQEAERRRQEAAEREAFEARWRGTVMEQAILDIQQVCEVIGHSDPLSEIEKQARLLVELRYPDGPPPSSISVLGL